MATYSNPGGPVAKKPKWAGIIWAISIFVVTAIVGIVLVAISIGTIANTVDDMESVDAGETRDVTLSSGDQYIFLGADTKRELNQVEVLVVDENGEIPDLEGGTTYTAENSDLAFESIGYIDVDTTTTYTVTVTGPPDSTVRIGKVPIGQIIGFLVGGIAIGAIGFIVALVIFIVALVRRSRVKKENRAAAWAASGGAVGPGSGPPPGQGPGQPYGQPAPGPYAQPYGTTAPPPAPPAAPGPPPSAPPHVPPPARPAAPPPSTPAPPAPAPTPAPPVPPSTPPPSAPTPPPPSAPTPPPPEPSSAPTPPPDEPPAGTPPPPPPA
jgi:hypothetical protein